MEKKSWKVKTTAAAHDVDLHWTYFGGHREVQVDGKTVDRSTVPMRWRSKQSFELDGVEVVVETRPKRRISPYFAISLWVDGAEVESDSPKSQWER